MTVSDPAADREGLEQRVAEAITTCPFDDLDFHDRAAWMELSREVTALVEADLRERIARDIEAEKDDLGDSTLWNLAVARCAHVARGDVS